MLRIARIDEAQHLYEEEPVGDRHLPRLTAASRTWYPSPGRALIAVPPAPSVAVSAELPPELRVSVAEPASLAASIDSLTDRITVGA
jgi:hypothetical protein